jgi:hypothetical protein
MVINPFHHPGASESLSAFWHSGKILPDCAERARIFGNGKEKCMIWGLAGLAWLKAGA